MQKQPLRMFWKIIARKFSENLQKNIHCEAHFTKATTLLTLKSTACVFLGIADKAVNKNTYGELLRQSSKKKIVNFLLLQTYLKFNPSRHFGHVLHIALVFLVFEQVNVGWDFIKTHLRLFSYVSMIL